MTKKRVEINLGKVDYDKLNTESDFKREAKRLLPGAMKELGREIAEGQWEMLKNQLGFKASDKSAFVSSAIGKYETDAAEKKRVEDYILQLLKENKEKQC